MTTSTPTASETHEATIRTTISKRHVLGDPKKFSSMRGKKMEEGRETVESEEFQMFFQSISERQKLHSRVEKTDANKGTMSNENGTKLNGSLHRILMGTSRELQKERNFEATREERALERWNNVQQEWSRVEKRLASKFGQDGSTLIMNRSAPAYRAKQERIDMIEECVPSHIRFGAKSWEMSLRTRRGEGTTYVRSGRGWPYPIWCPVPEKRKRVFETIRAPDNANNTISVMGVRDMGSEYANRYRKYIGKSVEFDPSDTMQGLKIQGQRLENEQDAALKILNNHDWRENYNSNMPNEFDEGKDHDEYREDATLTGPSFSLDANRLVFNTKPGELASGIIAVTNAGTCALQYSWERCEPISELQAVRADGRFQLTTESRGTLLPETTKQFCFSFVSERTGIFTDSYRLITIPSCEKITNFEVSLRGVTIAEVVMSDEDQLIAIGNIAHLDEDEKHDDGLSSMELPRESNWLVEEYRFDELMNTDEKRRLLFVQKNLDMILPEKVSMTLVEIFESLSWKVISILNEQNIANNVEKMEEDHNVKQDIHEQDKNVIWDHRLDSLKAMIQGVKDTDQMYQFLKLFQELSSVIMKPIHEQVLGSERNAHLADTSEDVVEPHISVVSQIRQAIAYEHVMDAIDEFINAAEFLHGQAFVQDSQKKGSKKKSAIEGADTNEDLLKGKCRSALLDQTKAIVVNTLNRIETLWNDSLQRIEGR